MVNKFVAIPALLFALSSPVPSWAQVSTARHTVAWDDEAACELNSRHIDTLVLNAKKSGERIFLISRLGKNEKGKIIERARLVQAHSLLSDVKSVEPNRIVKGIGDPATTPHGGIEIYLGSELFLVSYAKLGQYPCLQ